MTVNVQAGSGNIVTTAPQTLRGDVNLSGKVEIADAVLLVKALIGETELTAQQGKAADSDENNRLTVSDLTRLKQILL